MRVQETRLNCHVENGILSYIIVDNSVCIMGYEGTGALLVIPENIEDVPVCGIAKKAFLGNRSLQHIILPETIEWIGDWAFCNCAQLRRIEFLGHSVRFGKGLFSKDNKLNEIIFGSDQEKMPVPSRLLAVAVTLLDAEYLLDMAQTGCDEWYSRFDGRLLSFLAESSENALKSLVYCAEEDMGAKQQACLAEQECRKAYLALLRLAYPEYLEKGTEEKLTACLLDKEGLQTGFAWEAVKGAEAKEQTLLCDIMLEINGIREENISSVLEDLGDAYIELKAHLLKNWEQRKEQTSVWEKFVL